MGVEDFKYKKSVFYVSQGRVVGVLELSKVVVGTQGFRVEL